jgi:hypothetical protein
MLPPFDQGRWLVQISNIVLVDFNLLDIYSCATPAVPDEVGGGGDCEKIPRSDRPSRSMHTPSQMIGARFDTPPAGGAAAAPEGGALAGRRFSPPSKSGSCDPRDH